MKTRPFLKTISALILIIAIFLFVRCKTSQQAETAEIGAFLNAFNRSLQTGNTDSVLVYFDAGKQNASFSRMANLLLGKKEFNTATTPLAAIKLDMDGAVTTISNDGL